MKGLIKLAKHQLTHAGIFNEQYVLWWSSNKFREFSNDVNFKSSKLQPEKRDRGFFLSLACYNECAYQHH